MLTVNGILFAEAPKEERLVFSSLLPEALSDMMVKIKTQTHAVGAILLSTCDRIEVWLEDAKADGFEPLCRACGINPLRWKRDSYQKEGQEAVLWLFELASGLHSPLFGEDTIISQLEKAGELSRQSGCSSPTTQQLCNYAIAAAKKVQATIDVDQCEPSLCDALLSLMPQSKGLPVFIIGSSATARMVASALSKAGHRVTMTLRDERKTELVPPGVAEVSFEQRYHLIPSFPVVISATKGLDWALTQEAEPMEGALLIDLANPHDIDDALRGKNHARLVRDEELCYERTNRKRNVEASRTIIQTKIGEFEQWKHREEAKDDISFLAEAAAQDALFRLHPGIKRLHLEQEGQFLHQLSDTIYKCVLHQLYEHSQGNSYVDLSHPLTSQKALYPGDPDVSVASVATIGKEGYRVKAIALGSHSMTHLDAASHVLETGKTLDQYPLSRFFGSAYVLDGQQHIDVDLVSEGADMVLLSTGWEKRWGKDSYREGYPLYALDDVRKLLSRGIRLFGFDTPGPDTGEDLVLHKTILSADGLILENLTGLENLRGKTVSLVVLPLPVSDGDGAPARVVAIL